MTTARLQPPAERAVETVSVDGLVRKYLRRVYGFCRTLLANPMDVDDACQEVFLTVTRRQGDLGSLRDPLPWLLKIARLTCLYVRRRQQSAAAALGPDEAAVEEPDGGGGLGPPLRREEMGRVWEAMGRLPSRYRTILTLNYQQGLSHDQMAQVLDLSRGAVRVLLHRAVGRLRQEVRRLDDAPER